MRKQVIWEGGSIHAPLMFRLLGLILGCGFLTATSWGQPDPLDGLRLLHGSLAECKGEACLSLSDDIASELEGLLSNPDLDERWIEEVDFMAAVASGDDRLRVFTWNWTHDDRTSGYGGLVVDRAQKGEQPRYTRLQDESSADAPEINRAYKAEEWCGALYYDMVPDPVDDNTWFLLGWDDADAQVTRKVIETLQARPRGIRFGAAMLQSAMGMQRRHVLEFADAVQVSLRHQSKTKGRDGHGQRIVFDHLSPQEPHLSGITAYYGPDMTFEAYVPGKREGAPWVLQTNIEAIQPLPQDRPFNDPRPRNRRRN